MSILRVFSIILLTIILSSWGESGNAGNTTVLANETQGSIKAFFVKGKTTKSEVLQKFGKPESTTVDDDGETYLFYYYSSEGMSLEKELHVFLDENDKLSSYSFSINEL
jgi:hypothetical protein